MRSGAAPQRRTSENTRFEMIQRHQTDRGMSSVPIGLVLGRVRAFNTSSFSFFIVDLRFE